MEKYEEAEKEVRKAVDLEPENKEYVNHLDIILRVKKEVWESEKHDKKWDSHWIFVCFIKVLQKHFFVWLFVVIQ